MKRSVIFLLFAITITIMLSSCGTSLSEEELQKRREDYLVLIDSHHAVGYDNNFKLLKEKNSMEENLRILWKYYLSDHDFPDRDTRKNVELLIKLGNFDFIAEGLRYKAAPENPYYNDWPRDSQYNTKSETVWFKNDEVFWLMLLLPDSDIPEEHSGLKEVLAECGKNILGGDLDEPATIEGIWFYYEKTSPGLLKKIDPKFLQYFSNEIKTAYKNADEDIQNRFINAIDPENFRYIYDTKSPVNVYSLDEAEQLMKEFPPAGSWDGGYIRIVDDPTHREWIDGYGISDYNINTSVYGAYIYARESDALVPVINPVNARFAVYEEYTDGKYYATYTGDINFAVYLLSLKIRIVDLLTGEELFSELTLSNPPPNEISWTNSYGGSDFRIVDGKYFYNDFDWGRYAAVMEKYCDKPVSSSQQER
ncbi:MAG: hypothetical protein E7251_02155 [Paenibacillaceae bacterium]|nr:hypothetical protein [Paenibacillaceae bacterium]